MLETAQRHSLMTWAEDVKRRLKSLSKMPSHKHLSIIEGSFDDKMFPMQRNAGRKWLISVADRHSMTLWSTSS